MFSKGSWAIFGLAEGSQKNFEAVLADPAALLKLSQCHAVATLNHGEKKDGIVIGINPFENPRKDEQGAPLGKNDVTVSTGVYGAAAAEYLLNGEKPWYGFWAIFNEADDVDDRKSQLEQAAYADCSRPFKFLDKSQKESVESSVVKHNVGTRTQFPVLIDFESGRIYAETTNKDQIVDLTTLFEELGLKTIQLTWDFGNPEWAEVFLNAVVKKTKTTIHDAMQARADEIRRGLDIEPLEDKGMERIVNNFFACAELDSGQWAALFPNTAIKLYEGGEAVTASNPSDAFNLLSLDAWDATVRTAGLCFQELDSRFTKKGDEKQIRTDTFCFDLNQNWVASEEGVAFIRGFEVPNFKKEILRGIRKSKQEQPVAFYWSEYLRHINLGIFTLEDNIRLTLGIKEGGLSAITEPQEQEIEA